MHEMADRNCALRIVPQIEYPALVNPSSYPTLYQLGVKELTEDNDING